MKSINFYLLSFAILSIMFTSCGDDEPTTSAQQTYDNGVLIVNEGPFMGESATLDFYDTQKDSLFRNVYSTVNGGQVIGSILQSVTVIGDNAYLVVNNSAKIEVVDATTMEYKNTITGVYGPRYIADLGNGNAVVSEWGSDGVSGQIKLVDLNTMTVTDSLSVSGPEQMVVTNDKIYVANSGGFGESDQVSVHGLDLSLQMSISAGKRTIDMALDANGDIWVLSGGSYVDNDGANIARIKNDSLQIFRPLDGFPSDLIINGDGTNIYYVNNSIIYKIDIEFPSGLTVLNPEITGTIYGLGYDGLEETLYIGTTPDFSSESTTFVVDDNGVLKKSFTTGVLTNGFVSR